jgi:hypothetical protein
MYTTMIEIEIQRDVFLVFISSPLCMLLNRPPINSTEKCYAAIMQDGHLNEARYAA